LNLSIETCYSSNGTFVSDDEQFEAHNTNKVQSKSGVFLKTNCMKYFWYSVQIVNLVTKAAQQLHKYHRTFWNIPVASRALATVRFGMVQIKVKVMKVII
jgi:hypothetical protein